MWNDVIDNINIKTKDVVKIQNASIKQNNFGNLEIRCFDKNNITVDNEKTINIDETKINISSNRPDNEIEGDYYLISLKKKPIIYYLCPVCRKKLINGICQMHGKVEGNLFLVLSGIIDNGIERKDAVFFNTMVYDILGTKDLEKIEQIEHLPNYMNLLCIGNFYHLTGNVKENNFTKEDEIIVRKLELVDVAKKVNALEQEFSGFENAKV